MNFYLVLEEDGTSKFTLENSSGSILLEETFAIPVAPIQPLLMPGLNRP